MSPTSDRYCRALLALLVASSFAPAIWAQTLIWNGSGAPPVAGGDGRWSLTDANWAADPEASVFTSWTNGANAHFANNPGTVTIIDGVTVANISFGAGDYVIAGSTLTVGTNSIIDTAGFDATINSVLSGGSFTKIGLGTLLLGGSNNYTGSATLSGGILRINSADALAGSPVVFGGGTLQLDTGVAASLGNVTVGSGGGTVDVAADSTMTIANNLTGAGTLTKTGAGTLALSGANPFTGAIVADAGTLAITAEANLGVAPAAFKAAQLTLNGAALRTTETFSIQDANRGITLGANGGIFDIENDGNLGIASPITGPGRLTKTGGGVLSLSGANTYTGGTHLNAGFLRVDSAGALGTAGTITFGGGTLRYGNGISTDFSGRIADSAHQNINIDLNGQSVTFGSALTGEGSNLSVFHNGSLTLTAANTFSGGTTVVGNLATLILANPLALQNSTVNAPSTSSYSFGALTEATFGGLVNGGSLNLTNGNGAPVTLTIGQNNTDSHFVTVLSGSGSLVKVGTGFLTPEGETNTYTGSTTVLAGTLQLGANNVLPGSTALTIASGASFDANDKTQTIGSLAGSGTILFTGGHLTAGGNGTTTDFSGTITGNGTFTKAGEGVFTLTGINSFTGTTSVAGGALALAYASPLSSSNNFTINGGTLHLENTFSADVGSVDLLSGSITGESGNFLSSTAFNFHSGTVSANLRGTSALTKLDEGAVVLSGDNSYTGGTVLSGGQLVLGSEGALGTAGSITFHGGTLVFTEGNATDYSSRFSDASEQNINIDTNGRNVTFAGNMSSSGGLFAKLGAGTLSLTGTNEITGGTSLLGGTLALGSEGALGTASTIFFRGGTLRFTAANTTDYSNRFSTEAEQTFRIDTGGQNVDFNAGLASSGGSLVKSGFGTLTLSGSNTYNGTTTVQQGTLALGSNERLANTSALVVSGGTFDLGAHTQTVNTVTLESGSISGSGGSLISGNYFLQSGFASANLTGGQLLKTGAGEVTLAGSNSFSGGIQLNAGTLVLGSASAISDAGTISFTGGTLGYSESNALDYSSRFSIASGQDYRINLGGRDVTYASALGSEGGNLTVSGSGSLTLTSANTFSGTTAVASEGARLILANSGALAFSTVDPSQGGTISFGELSSANFGGLGNNGGSLNLTNDLESGVALQLGGNNGNSSFNVRLTGAGSLTKAGTGTLTASGETSTYSGGTNVEQGTLQLGASDVLPVNTALDVATGSTFDVAFHSQTIGALTGFGTIRLGTGEFGGVLNFGNAASNATFNGTISGTGSIAKVGFGTQILGGNSDFTGTTFVNSGTLALGTSTAFSSNSALDVRGGNFDLNGHSATVTSVVLNSGSIINGELESGASLTAGSFEIQAGTISADLAGTGGLVKNGSGLGILSGTNSYTGPTVINEGTLSFTRRVSLNSGNIAGLTDSQLTVNSGAIASFNVGSEGPFSSEDIATIAALGSETGGFQTGSFLGLQVNGNGEFQDSFIIASNFSNPNGGLNALGLIKLGNGILTLSGDNSYTGGTVLERGSLELGSAGALGTEGAITFHNGNLRFTELNTTDYSSRFSTEDSQSYRFDLNNQNVTFNSDLTSAGSSLLVFNGGSLTLNGTAASSSVEIDNDSTLRLGDNERLNSAASLILFHGALDLNGFNQTVGSVLVFGSGVINSGVLTGSAFTFNGGGLVTASLAGDATLTKNGNGTLTLTGNSTYTGGTFINTGLINFNAVENFGTGNVTINDFGFAGLQWAEGTSTDISGRLNPITGATTFDTNGNDVTFANPVLGESNGYLVKEGAGTLTLAPGGTFGLGLELSQGTVAISADSALGAVPENPQADHLNFNGGTLRTTADFVLETNRSINLHPAGGTIQTDGETTLTYGGDISGEGDFAKVGAGTLVLAGTSSHSGTTRVNEGTLAVGSDTALPGSSNLEINGGTLDVGAFQASAPQVTLNSGTIVGGSGVLLAGSFNVNSGTISANLAGDELIKNFAGTVTLTGNNTYTGGTILNQGLLVSGSENALGALGTIFFNGGTLGFAPGGTTDYSSRFSASAEQTFRIDTGGQNVEFASGISSSEGSLQKLGDGTLTLSGLNSFDTTQIFQGTLALGIDQSLSASSSLIISGGSFDLHQHNQTVGHVVLDGGGIIGSGELGGLLMADNFFVESGSISANLSGGSLVKDGANDVHLSGTNSFGGDITLSQGTLVLNSVGAIDVNPLSELGSRIIFNGGTLGYTGANTTDYTARFSSADGQQYRINLGGQNITFAAAPLSSAGGNLTVSGTGTLTLATANTFSGTTVVNGDGTALVITDPLALQASIVDPSHDGRIAFGGDLTAATFGGLGNFGGQLSLTNESDHGVTLTLGALNTDTFFNVSLSGNGSLTKAGTGTLTVASNTNTYSGATTIAQGTLALGNDNALPTQTTVAIAPEATFDVADHTQTIGALTDSGTVNLGFNEGDGYLTVGLGGASSEFAGAIRGNGELTKVGGGTLTLSGNSDFAGVTFVQEGTLALGSNTGFSNFADLRVTGGTMDLGGFNGSVHGVTLESGSIIDGSEGAVGSLSASSFEVRSGTISANLTGEGGLTKNLEGLVVLSGNNTYAGPTEIVAGSLQFAQRTSFRGGNFEALSSSSLLVHSGATAVFTAGGAGQFTSADLGAIAALGSNDAGFLAGSSLGIEVKNTGTGAFNLSADLNPFNSVSLTKLGEGTLILSGHNTYTGGTNLNAGTLELGSADALGTSGAINFNGGLLNFSAANHQDYSDRFSSADNQLYYFGLQEQNVTFDHNLTSAGSELKVFFGGNLTLNGTVSSGYVEASFGSTLTLGDNDRLTPVADLNVSGGATFAAQGFSQTLKSITLNNGSITASPGSDGTLTAEGIEVRSGSVSANLGGTATLIKSDAEGTVALSGNNSYTGGTFVNAGTLRLASAGALGNTGAITFGTSGVLEFTAGNTTDYSDRFSKAESQSFNISVDSGVNLTLATALNVNGGEINKLGEGTLTLASTSLYNVTFIRAGTLALGADFTTDAFVSVIGGTFDIGNFTVTASAVALNGGTIAGTGQINAGTTFVRAGTVTTLLGGSGGLVKDFAGTTTLTRANTYTGATSVTGGTLVVGAEGSLASNDVSVGSGDGTTGTLLVNGALAGNIVTVASGGTLGGSGHIAGATTIQSGGTLAPGNSPGLLTFGGDLTLAAGSTTRIQIDGTARGITHDALDVAGTLTYGGTLTIDFSTATLLDTSYNLFSVGVTTGSFGAIEVTGFYSASLVNTGGVWSGPTNSNEFGFIFSESTGNFLASATAVPEPSTYALFALGALSLAFFRRRKN